jgi:quercetin dioxygenase-like cupin family protein
VIALRVLRSRRWTVVIVGVLAIGTFAAVALGSVGVGFLSETLVTGNVPDRVEASGDGVKLQTKGSADVRVQKIVITPGGFSGWHHHPGVVIVTVASGVVTFTHGCTTTNYGPGLPTGSVFVESGDAPAQASSVAGATIFATFVAPHAAPPVFRIEDTGPASCPAGGDSDDNQGGHNN